MADQPLVIELDAETFLHWEEKQRERHELLNGFVFAFAGGDVAHAVLAANVIALLVPHAKPPCRVFTADAKVVSKSNSVTYADAGLTCDDAIDAVVVRSPLLLVEVVSESSQRRDRVDKRAIYRRFVSLRWYVLIDRSRRLVEVDERDDEGTWVTSAYEHGSASAMSIVLPLDVVYAGTPLASTGPESPAGG